MDHMEIALSLAKRALGSTSPNPAVGAVVVKDGVVVGKGYTQPPGSDHAEVMALRQAGEKSRGAIMYVTLEPCCHFGRTPPCTEAIISSGVSEVHIAMLDPNPQVYGKGSAQLEENGIKTIAGEHEEEALEINEGYIRLISTGVPFVIAKFAMSIDGKIATKTGDSKWISCEESREYAHNLRKRVDAIIVGVNTVLSDNPRLTARANGREIEKLKVIVDSHGRTPSNARALRGKTILASVAPMDTNNKRRFAELGAMVLELPSRNGLVDLQELLRELGQVGVTSVLVEGGGELLGSFFDQGLVDRVYVFIAPILIGGEATTISGNGVERVAQATRLQKVKAERLGEDVLISGYVR